MSNFAMTFESDDKTVAVYDWDGVSWYEAPIPRRWHSCLIQTLGFIDSQWYERCACGAIRRSHTGKWLRRNDRRKNR